MGVRSFVVRPPQLNMRVEDRLAVLVYDVSKPWMIVLVSDAEEVNFAILMRSVQIPGSRFNYKAKREDWSK